MEFRETLLAAQRNQQEKSSVSNYYYKAKFDPPKKEQKAKDRLSANIQKFLAKKDEEERQKKLEAQRKREELLAMRDPKALRKIQKTLKVIKSANKSVIADAIDRDNTAVTREGPDQPDQDDYGYESQAAAAIYEKMMQKYSKLPDEPKFPTSSKWRLFARSKLPKKRRRVLPVEQPRRKRDATASNRRVNAVKHPVVLKDLQGANKFGVNGMNVISLALQGPSNLLRPPHTAQPLQARAPIVESPIVNTQCATISLASLQPPLMTAPPLQPRPATTGSLDLMLPLQPKLLPGYNLQSSFLSSTLSTVRPPDLPDKLRKDEYKPSVDIIIEKSEESIEVDNKQCCDVDRIEENDNDYNNDNDNDNENDNDTQYEINSNVIDTKESVSNGNDSPNNNSI